MLLSGLFGGSSSSQQQSTQTTNTNETNTNSSATNQTQQTEPETAPVNAPKETNAENTNAKNNTGSRDASTQQAGSATLESIVAANLSGPDGPEAKADEDAARLIALAAQDAYRTQSVIDQLLAGPADAEVTFFEAPAPKDEKGAAPQQTAAANPLDKPAQAPSAPQPMSKAA